MELKGIGIGGYLLSPNAPKTRPIFLVSPSYYIDKKLGRLITHLSNDNKLSIFPPLS